MSRFVRTTLQVDRPQLEALIAVLEYVDDHVLEPVLEVARLRQAQADEMDALCDAGDERAQVAALNALFEAS